MGLDKLGGLYRQVVMDHAKNPRNKGSLDEVTHQVELLNPTCGDMIQVQCAVRDHRIESVKFIGEGCSISMASASMMTEVMVGKSLDEVRTIVQQFDHLIGGTAEDVSEAYDLHDAECLAGVKQFPARYKCAALAWHAIDQMIEKVSEVNE